MASNFAAQLSAFAAATKERTTAVFRESAERVVEEMQTPVGAGGNMPVDTGFLRASLQASTTAPIPINSSAQPDEGSTHAYNAGPITLTIAGADLGETIYVTYTANYARDQEYGSNGREGRAFVRSAAQRWPTIVTAVCGDLQSRIEGSTPST